MSMRRRALLRAGAAALLANAAPGQAQPAAPAATHANAFSFALIGDIPYYTLEEQALRRIYQAFPADLAFAIHVGDIKSGAEACSDALIERRMNLLQTCPVPLVLLPGDNEWVDCARQVAGAHDPLERLSYWRLLAARDRRSASALGLAHHPDWPELMHWRRNGIAASFVTLNVPGSHNGLIDSPAGRAQRRQRNAANAAWLEQAGQRARVARDRFLFVVIHANTDLDRGPPQADERGGAYAPFKRALLNLLQSFPGQVIVLYGDTHQHRIDHPWEALVGKRLTAIQCYGSPFNGAWVRIDVDSRLTAPRVSAQALS